MKPPASSHVLCLSVSRSQDRPRWPSLSAVRQTGPTFSDVMWPLTEWPRQGLPAGSAFMTSEPDFSFCCGSCSCQSQHLHEEDVIHANISFRRHVQVMTSWNLHTTQTLGFMRTRILHLIKPDFHNSIPFESPWLLEMRFTT